MEDRCALFLEEMLAHLACLMIHRVNELEKAQDPAPVDSLITSWPINEFTSLFQAPYLTATGVIAAVLAISPDAQPHLLDESVWQVLKSPGEYPRVGGVRGRESRVFLPTAETFYFLVGARSVRERFAAAEVLEPPVRRPLFRLDPAPPGEPSGAARLVPGPAWWDHLTGGRAVQGGTPDFPAERIRTELDWEDLVLDPSTLERVRELEIWISHGTELMNDLSMRRRILPGYRALFFGPPGTGKSLTASLLGKHTGREVYRIDLSLVVSKFIGETEKNLSRIFAQAENRSWILFFDEADALFGKRTQVRDAHDRYANQEVSYLLQRVEAFEGLVILASNFRSNIDDAFVRRFQSVIHFPKPTAAQRQELWRKLLPAGVQLGLDVQFPQICQQHELTGANIANVIQYACLHALKRGERRLRLPDILAGIEREYQKEGKAA